MAHGDEQVDRFFRVRAVPKCGEKGFFASPTKILEDSVRCTEPKALPYRSAIELD
jgi:hypothetical protein